MRTIHEIMRALNNIHNALVSHDVERIRANLSLLSNASLVVSKFLFRHDVSVFEKEKLIANLNKMYSKIVFVLRRIMQEYFYSLLPLIIDVLGNLYMTGCVKIFDDLFGDIISRARLNLNVMAFVADKLIECGCTDLAFTVLNDLFLLKYNLPVVLVNLAIASYMIGKPKKSRYYIQIYEKITRKKLRLKTSLLIVLGEIDEYKSL